MILRKTLLSCAALSLLSGLALSTAQAQVQLSFLGGVFNFTNGTGFSSAGTATTFDFVDNAGTITTFSGQQVQATITLSGTVSGLASEVTVGSTNIVQQNLSGITETITSDGGAGNPFAAGTKLIGVSASSATLSGSGHNLTFSLAGNNIFSSDVFGLGGAQTQTLLATTSSALGLATTSSSTTSGPITVSTGTLASFTATAHSNVFNSGSVPEASTLMGLGSLVLGGGFLGLRRRKA